MIDLGKELKNSTLITSKTDLKGTVVYCNKDFIQYSGYKEEEIFGKPHSIVRHSDMPRAVFKLLWDYVQRGEEIFAFVKNKTKSGGHYWVFANVTPSFDTNNQIVGYYSVRRKPNAKAVEKIAGVYREMKNAESQSMEASLAVLHKILDKSKMDYNQLILTMQDKA